MNLGGGSLKICTGIYYFRTAILPSGKRASFLYKKFEKVEPTFIDEKEVGLTHDIIGDLKETNKGECPEALKNNLKYITSKKLSSS